MVMGGILPACKCLFVGPDIIEDFIRFFVFGHLLEHRGDERILRKSDFSIADASAIRFERYAR
jgi:hypothetical protein